MVAESRKLWFSARQVVDNLVALEVCDDGGLGF
jgi:hypothetical protein